MFDRVKSEIVTLRTLLRTLGRLKPLGPDVPLTLPDFFEAWAQKTPDAPALVCDAAQYSFAQFDAAASRYARWALARGIKRGDVVALLMENGPDFLFATLGLAKIGATAALLNTNLTGKPLAHCINIAKPEHLILDAALAQAWTACTDELEALPQVWARGGSVEGARDLDAALAAVDGAAVGREARPDAALRDRCFLIYTSGTTGLPKAANISHLRAAIIMNSFAGSVDMKPSDRIYVCLPLYHTAGLLAAAGAALLAGGSVAIARRFSVTHFWDDITKFEATITQYIGEMCRYLLNAPPHPKERSHKLRAAVGNGLRPEIWCRFKERFAIPKIFEFYGATEGNVSLMNVDGRPGAVGRIPPYARSRFPVRVVKFDVETEQPVRGPDGFCIECAPGEVGEGIGLIGEDPRTRFEGYTGNKETEKKVLHDVFKKGDRYFRTGDLIRIDWLGYVYFVDRIGDTFRWKGENVATSEVAEILALCPGVKEANVYGVKVPDMDGKAGMASLTVADDFDLSALAEYLEDKLPGYAQPIFVRIQSEIEVTATFKHRKIDLVKEGFKPDLPDPIYFHDAERHAYVPLDHTLYERIERGEVKM